MDNRNLRKILRKIVIDFFAELMIILLTIQPKYSKRDVFFIEALKASGSYCKMHDRNYLTTLSRREKGKL